LNFVSPSYKRYYELANNIVNKNPYNIQYVSVNFNKFYELAVKAIEKNPRSLTCIGKCYYYFDLAVLATIKTGKTYYEYVNLANMNNEEQKFLQTLSNSCALIEYFKQSLNKLA
jgi:hypothetical protein